MLSLRPPIPLQCPWRQLLQESLPEPREVFVSVQLPLLKVLSLPLSIGLPLPQPLSLLLAIQVQTRRTSQSSAFLMQWLNFTRRPCLQVAKQIQVVSESLPLQVQVQLALTRQETARSQVSQLLPCVRLLHSSFISRFDY